MGSNLPAGRELDELIADKVMGLEWRPLKMYYAPEGWYPKDYDGPNPHPYGLPGYQDELPAYSSEMGAAWQVAEKMTVRMGYDNPDFEWRGPLFKPENRYLTAEGYPLGTTCWYVVVEMEGRRLAICADTAPHAICLAALQAVGYKEG
jgi:hypothetical protein